MDSLRRTIELKNVGGVAGLPSSCRYYFNICQ